MINKDNIHQLTIDLKESSERELTFDHNAILDEIRNDTQDQQTLAIKILSIAGGILGALAFAGFLFAAELYESAVALTTVGIVMTIAAIVLGRWGAKVIWDTFSASFYLMGYTCVIFASDRLDWSTNLTLTLFIVIEIATLYLSRSYLLNFLSVLLLTGNVVAMLIHNNLQDLYYPLVALLSIKLTLIMGYEIKILTTGVILPIRTYHALRSGLLFSLLFLLIIGNNNIYNFELHDTFSWVASTVFLLLIALTTFKIAPLLRINKSLYRILISIVAMLLLLPTYYYPAVSFSILTLLLSFHLKYKTGLAVGIIAFLYFISRFYYDLNYSLLTKSLLLFGTGLLFLLLYTLVHKKLIPNERL
ncbi:DUF4401 domain-containing protein [Sphingobacterium sp. SGG-5]|uniref:DUF4401 domain-containing protein n=1 Tax=Sphingobacterium sp. SGG-5 TaxID=2710881 RepID=UPI0013EB59E6|nr:DUF4401 domain-containing protein [Sphingobacterium sp. SGG-5]NGM61889.1 DUF4401 domain-containing protein [Sphingobacterium sp. SGG-5]